MGQSPVEIVPIEIWEKIFSYATATSLLPFTESGEIASSLIDTLDLFSTRCATFRKYYDETLVTVRCLRLVCRTWATILRGVGNGIAYAKPKKYYSPYSHLFGGVTYLSVGRISEYCSCTRALKDEGLCLCAQLNSQSGSSIDKLNEDLLTRFFSDHLKIVYWRVYGTIPLTFPMKSLGNLRAFSLYFDDVMPSLSFKDLFSSAPRLTHLQLPINDSCAHLLSESAESLSLTYLNIEITLFGGYKERGFLWSFPRLRTFVIYGVIRHKHQADLEGFLSRHKNSIAEFEVIDFRHCIDSSPPLDLNLIRPSLWKVCPNIRVIGTYKRMINVFKTSEDDWETHSIDIPPLTFIIGGYYPLWDDDFVTLTLIKKRLNVEKIVVTETWEQLRQQGCLRLKGVDIGTRETVDLLLEKLREIDILLVDRYGSPITHFLHELHIRLGF
jgi:hypothetical protein